MAQPCYSLFRYDRRFPMGLGGALPSFQLAYETWGELSPARDNAILLTTGLSPSSHARSHATRPEPGWWEESVGPELAIRFVQRQAVLADPDWRGGNYDGHRGPLNGLHVARQLGTISYRGPGEWAPRFGRQRVEGADGGASSEPRFPDRPGVEVARTR